MQWVKISDSLYTASVGLREIARVHIHPHDEGKWFWRIAPVIEAPYGEKTCGATWSAEEAREAAEVRWGVLIAALGLAERRAGERLTDRDVARLDVIERGLRLALSARKRGAKTISIPVTIAEQWLGFETQASEGARQRVGADTTRAER